MADKIIDVHKRFVTNSIPDQRLTHPNQLTIKMWNNIINILRVQANDLTKYIQDLHHWLIGDSEYGTISFPAEHQSFINFLLDAHEQFMDGTTILGKAKADRHGNIIDTTYATTATLQDLDRRIVGLLADAKEEVYENVYKKPQTYSRDEALAIGLIEVSEYDAKTGEITVTYNPNTVDVTYDEDTGELIFSQKTYLLDSGALPKRIRTLKLGLSEAEINNIKNSVTEDIDTLRSQLFNGQLTVRYAVTADVAKTAQTAEFTTNNKPIASKEDLKAYDEAKNLVSTIKKYVNADGSLKAKYDGNGNQIDTTYATQKMLTDLIGGAPESYNTLKEIADYINQDKSGTSSMLASIQTNASNIIKNSNYIAKLDQKIADVESNIAKEIAEALAGEY